MIPNALMSDRSGWEADIGSTPLLLPLCARVGHPRAAVNFSKAAVILRHPNEKRRAEAIISCQCPSIPLLPRFDLIQHGFRGDVLLHLLQLRVGIGPDVQTLGNGDDKFGQFGQLMLRQEADLEI
jgi:hypothetical protein